MGENNNSNNKYCRKIRIRNFRNIGFQEPTEIVINRTLDKNRLGGLVTIIGLNNSGKSNVLDAISCAVRQNYLKSDTPDFLVNDLEPTECEITAYDGEEFYSYTKDSTETPQNKVINDRDGAIKRIYDRLDELVTRKNIHLFEETANTVLQHFFDKYPELNTFGILNTDEITPEKLKILSYVFHQNQYHGMFHGYTELFPYAYEAAFNEDGSNLCYEDREEEFVNMLKEKKPFDSRFEEKFGYPLVPNLIYYKETNIKQTELESEYKPYNQFMRKALRICNGTKIVSDAYDAYCEKKASGFLKQATKILNKNAEAIAERFNELYYQKNAKYSFEFSLSENHINFEMFLNEQPLILDDQSTGFRWFFNMFFNLLCDSTLKPGDLIIIDEPATSLSVLGQKELSAFIREFAVRMNVTFIISTHSPFFVDCDHLDEVRIVERKADGSAIIHDKFSVIDPESPDQMDPILKAMTIGREILASPDKTTIFVEGITDYNYLTAFKMLNKIEDIAFLPINGIRKESLTDDDIISRLMKIDRKPVLLVDGDEAGDEMKKAAEGKGIEVISLKDIDGRFRTIESLFKEEDLVNFNLKGKSWHSSSVFKQYIEQEKDELSKYTMDNFAKVLKYLSE